MTLYYTWHLSSFGATIKRPLFYSSSEKTRKERRQKAKTLIGWPCTYVTCSGKYPCMIQSYYHGMGGDKKKCANHTVFVVFSNVLKHSYSRSPRYTCTSVFIPSRPQGLLESFERKYKHVFSNIRFLLLQQNRILSYYVAVFQWITSCHKKCYDQTCINAFAEIRNVFDDVRNNNVNFLKVCPL